MDSLEDLYRVFLTYPTGLRIENIVGLENVDKFITSATENPEDYCLDASYEQCTGMSPNGLLNFKNS